MSSFLKTSSTFLAVLMAGVSVVAAGGPGPGGSPANAQVSLKIPSEMAPPGGLVQMKLMVTEPTPISSGNIGFGFDSATFDDPSGIEVFNPTGDASGVALVNGAQVRVFYTTSTGALGTDYPIMTIALPVRADAAVGSQTQFNLDSSSYWILGLLGAASMRPIAPATVTVGGSIAICNVIPGGGVLPAGTTVRILGVGFQPKTHVQLSAIKASAVSVVSPGEIQFTLAESTDMTGKKIQVVNPDGSQDTYFSYMRGVPLWRSTRPLLAKAVPIFSSVTHSLAVFAPMLPASGTQFSGIGMQNPGLSDVTVRLALYSAGNTLLGSSSFTLPAGYRVIGDISEVAGFAAAAGSHVVVSSTQPVQVFGFVGDEAAGRVTPFGPVYSKP